MRSLAHNTWRGRGACWSSGMGLGRIDKLYSLTWVCMKPHKVVRTDSSPFSVGTATGELGLTLTHHTPGLGVSHHLTPL